MTAFTVISSIVSPAAIVEFVSGQYSFIQNARCRLLKTGINATYRIDGDNASFVFRIYSYNWRTQTEINEELDLLLLLQRNGVSVSYPVAGNDGIFIQTINAPEGMRYAVLFTYANGKKLLSFSRDAHYNAGMLMARVHSVTEGLKQDRITYTPEVLLHHSLDRIRQFLPEESEEMQFLLATRPLLETELLNADKNMLRHGIVHLDIWFDNLNISDDNEITLFDFDFCGNGWLCLDLAYYIMQLHSTGKEEAARNDKIEAFYCGYESISKISSEERRLIPLLGICLYYFYLGVQCQRFDNWSNTFLNDVYLKRFITILIRGYYEKAISRSAFVQ
ncbi:phosphotransferase enzyme family protein [Flavihumibacter petaseus]|uniref:Putative phosphotransferase n=1 Tax=Flavihumibacter petaseus NBRC 106054 TaxID=1220578 RepID=A0A0E9N028_9BACT|nr:phosphotransferase [Flavihumibacter petaseus]GAO43174.1 putative phosphotransferase [Flavihumibacter petaseus NBRC 106054]